MEVFDLLSLVDEEVPESPVSDLKVSAEGFYHSPSKDNWEGDMGLSW